MVQTFLKLRVTWAANGEVPLKQVVLSQKGKKQKGNAVVWTNEFLQCKRRWLGRCCARVILCKEGIEGWKWLYEVKGCVLPLVGMRVVG